MDAEKEEEGKELTVRQATCSPTRVLSGGGKPGPPPPNISRINTLIQNLIGVFLGVYIWFPPKQFFPHKPLTTYCKYFCIILLPLIKLKLQVSMNTSILIYKVKNKILMAPISFSRHALFTLQA